MGIPLSQDQLQDVAEVSGVMDADMFGYMDENIATQCSQYLPSVGTVTCMYIHILQHTHVTIL